MNNQLINEIVEKNSYLIKYVTSDQYNVTIYFDEGILVNIADFLPLTYNFHIWMNTSDNSISLSVKDNKQPMNFMNNLVNMSEGVLSKVQREIREGGF